MTTIDTLRNAYIIGQENFESWSQGFDPNGYLKVLPHPDEKIAYEDPFHLWQQDHLNYQDGIYSSQGANGEYYSSWGPREVLEVVLDMDELQELVIDGFGILEQGDGFIDWLGKATPYDILRAYNGRIPGPMLITEPGDTIKITLNNNLDEQVTNLHTHGLHVSPLGRGDNVLTSVAPGESWEIEIAIPENHFIGPQWYHPHFHGRTNEQVASGLGGYLLINPRHDLPDLDKFDPVINPAFFMAIQTFGIDQEYRFPSPDDPLNQSGFGTFVPAGTPLAPSTSIDFEAEYALENIFTQIEGTNVFEVFIDGTDPDAPFPIITGKIYGTIDQNGIGNFNSDPTVFGLLGYESGFIALEDGNGNRVFGTDEANSLINFFTSEVNASGLVQITGGEGLFSGVTGSFNLSELGTFNPDPTQPYIADLKVDASLRVPRAIDFADGVVKYNLSEAPFVGYNAKPAFYNPANPQGFPVPGPDFSSAYGEGALAEPTENVIHTVNGQYNPTIDTSTGAWNLFSFANMTVNSFHIIQLLKEEPDGTLTPQDMLLTAIDGDAAGVVEEIRRDVTVSPILNPGSRITLQNWFEEPGKYYFIANATNEILGDNAPLLTQDKGFQDGHLIWGSQVLATVEVTGDPTPTGPFPEPYDVLVEHSNEINELVDSALAGDVTKERDFVWSANIGGAIAEGRFPDDTEVETFEGTYRINGEYYATEGGGMPPLTMPMLGTQEIWNVSNISGISDGDLQELGIDIPLLEWHPFHIHQNDFVVLSINGIPVEDIDDNYLARVLSDTIALPPSHAPGSVTPENPYGIAQLNGNPSVVSILMEFADYPGAYVNHCHILFHEDAGMMAVVKVILNTEDTWMASSTSTGNSVELRQASNTDNGLQLNPYQSNFNGGVEIAIGDVNFKDTVGEDNVNVNDNITDVVTIQRQRQNSSEDFTIKVFDGAGLFAHSGNVNANNNSLILAEIQPFQSLNLPTDTLNQKTSIAVGDIDGDGFGDIVVGIGGDGITPLIEVYSGKTYQKMAELAPFHHEDYNGSINVAVGDVNGDNFYDILVAQGEQGRGLIEAYDGKALEGIVRSGAINSLSAIGVAHEISVFHEEIQPYGESYTGGIDITSGYVLQTPDSPNGKPVQTSAGNITTLALGDVPEGHEKIKVHTLISSHGGHGEHGGHGGHSVSPEVVVSAEFTPEQNLHTIEGTFADINGIRGVGALLGSDENGNKQLISLQQENNPEYISLDPLTNPGIGNRPPLPNPPNRPSLPNVPPRGIFEEVLRSLTVLDGNQAIANLLEQSFAMPSSSSSSVVKNIIDNHNHQNHNAIPGLATQESLAISV